MKRFRSRIGKNPCRSSKSRDRSWSLKKRSGHQHLFLRVELQKLQMLFSFLAHKNQTYRYSFCFHFQKSDFLSCLYLCNQTFFQHWPTKIGQGRLDSHQQDIGDWPGLPRDREIPAGILSRCAARGIVARQWISWWPRASDSFERRWLAVPYSRNAAAGRVYTRLFIWINFFCKKNLVASAGKLNSVLQIDHPAAYVTIRFYLAHIF